MFEHKLRLHIILCYYYTHDIVSVHCVHIRFYSTGTHFHRILHLLANEVMLKARDIVGEDILDNPEMVNHVFPRHTFYMLSLF